MKKICIYKNYSNQKKCRRNKTNGFHWSKTRTRIRLLIDQFLVAFLAFTGKQECLSRTPISKNCPLHALENRSTYKGANFCCFLVKFIKCSSIIQIIISMVSYFPHPLQLKIRKMDSITCYWKSGLYIVQNVLNLKKTVW